MTQSISAAADRYYEQIQAISEQPGVEIADRGDLAHQALITIEEHLKKQGLKIADRGDLAHQALIAIEEHLKKQGLKIADGYEDGIHEALWEAFGYIEVVPA